MGPDGYGDAGDPAGEGEGDRPGSSPDPHRPVPADGFWVGVLVVIAVVLVLTVLVTHMDWSPGNPTNNLPPYK
ncbi:hypothetical protein [Streptomyces sp. NPDC047042]|uniref:hypothetical protein n=1 Tax=Streptomyces sp. NPDC047042 TaxID=3154807 RepID=UPI0033F3E195